MLKFHHIGCLVDSIDESMETYKAMLLLKTTPAKIYVSSQEVFVCFIELDKNNYLELVEPTNESSIVAKLKQKGHTYYHAGYMVDDFDKELELLDEQGFKLLNVFNSEAFKMKRCAFLYSPDLHLIEIMEE